MFIRNVIEASQENVSSFAQNTRPTKMKYAIAQCKIRDGLKVSLNV